VIVAPTLVTCPDCEGEGCLEYEVSGGHYDDHLGQWYPTWEMRACVTCRGTGEVTACLHCYHDRCFCDGRTQPD
jgi:RecJ-like exonuclease